MNYNKNGLKLKELLTRQTEILIEKIEMLESVKYYRGKDNETYKEFKEEIDELINALSLNKSNKAIGLISALELSERVKLYALDYFVNYEDVKNETIKIYVLNNFTQELKKNIKEFKRDLIIEAFNINLL